MKDVKKFIRLIYVEGGKSYHGEINRADFIDQISHMVNWYPSCNDNAKKLCELLPNIDYIKINKDIINTQDVPCIEYQFFGEDTPKCMKFMRMYTIIWSLFMFQCEEAKKNN